MKKSKIFLSIIIMLLFLYILSATIYVGVNARPLLQSINNDIKIKVLFISILVSIMVILSFITIFKLGKKHIRTQILYNVSVFALLSGVYYMTMPKINIYIGICVIGVFTILTIMSRIVMIKYDMEIIKKIKQPNEEKYVKLNVTSSLPSGVKVNDIEAEFDKMRNNSEFYKHKSVNEIDYFEEKKRNRPNLEYGSFIEVKNNYYENAFMDNPAYYSGKSNNIGMAFDYNPDVKNPKYAGRPMKDTVQKNTTDVDKLNEEFVKKYNSKNGL